MKVGVATMAWTYGGDPTSSPKDAVRFEIGDTDKEYPIMQDEEIEYVLAQERSVLSASARCCEILARKYASDPTISIGRTRVSGSTAARIYKELALELRRRATATSGQLFSGTTNVAPYFTRGMLDNI